MISIAITVTKAARSFADCINRVHYQVWLALWDTGHVHSAGAWKWREILPDDHKLIFSRYTQIGLLRLLTNVSVMGGQTLTLRKAWVFMTVDVPLSPSGGFADYNLCCGQNYR